MRFTFGLLAAFLPLLVVGCFWVPPLWHDKDDPELTQYVFETGGEGWIGDFADLPIDFDEDLYELGFDPQKPLPPELGEDKTALFITGHNRSDDLFMFIKRRLDGLQPNTTYQVQFEVEIATNVPAGLGGIGGAPGESVFLKAGASVVEPLPIEENDAYRMNIDKGNQATEGQDAIILGNVAKPSPDASDAFELKTLDNQSQPFEVTTDADGAVWVLVGTDSGFEGPTGLYYTLVRITFGNMGESNPHR